MDIEKTEIQILQKEISSLHEEIAALRKEISNNHQALIKFIASPYLSTSLNHFAGMQTAELIIANMSKVKAFGNKQSYLEYVLSHIENISGGIGVWCLSRSHYKYHFFAFARQNCLRL